MSIFRIFSILIFQLISFSLAAQSGNYFLSHHTPDDESLDYLTFDIAQTERGVIYFANKSGVVEFDGRNWSVIDSPGAIYTLSIANGNDLYAGGLTGFGRLSLNDDNILSFEVLSVKENAKNIFRSKATADHVYFLNEQNLFGFNLNTQNVDIQIANDNGESFTNLFELDGSIFISYSNSTLRKIEGNKLVEASIPFLEGDELLFANKLLGTSKYLIGTLSGKLFSHEANISSEIVVAEADYLDTNVMIGGRWVNENMIAIGTLSGGVVFLNPVTGNVEQIINYYTGLPDNEVFALMTDRNQGVWVAHDYGFTRIAPYLPFRSFNHYPGLSGNLLSAYSEDSLVYVGTSVGLYKLNREEIYEEETYFVTRLKKTQSADTKETIEEDEKEERKKSRKGLFGFLKRNKNQEEEKEPEIIPEKKETVKKIVEKKTRTVLKALDFAYKKVEGIEGKVTQLMKVEGKLLASGVAGVFEVNELKANEILGTPVRTVFYSSTLKQTLVSTYNDRVRSIKWLDGAWQETFLFDSLRAYVGNIFEDHVQNIWLCGRADVVKVELIDEKISSISSVPFTTPVMDEAMGFALGTEVFVAASGTFHKYDVIRHEFSKYDSLPGPRKYFTSVGTFWYNDGHRWRTVDQKLRNNLRLEWLGLFPDIRSLSMADNGNGLWLITSTNELYKFAKSDYNEISNNYPLFLREVRGPGSKLTPGTRLVVDEEESALSFEFIQPEYTNALAIEYQYMIEGISKNWSEWSVTNNVVNFPFLTQGKYRLRIKSRDLFGQESELQAIDFTVIPPYWKRTWFYALEFVFFAMLVMISLKLSAANRKYRHISQLLSILTVIMLIQLVQNTVESYISVQTTPVTDFFIQVFIALLILPLEYGMRRVMVEVSEGKYDLKKLTKGKV